MRVEDDLSMLLARLYLEWHCTRREAYHTLQLELMRCFLQRGGDIGEWCAHYAPAFHQRFGWMLLES
jgi:hypothetical protein